MKNIKINIELLNNAKGIPEYGTKDAAGLDLRAGVDKKFIIKPREFSVVPTGIILEIPTGFEGQIRPRSGLAAKNGITVLNSPGTIDSDYRGEVKVILINSSKSKFIILPGMKIAQLLIAPCYKIILTYKKKIQINTSRGKKGFGSTGT